MILSYTALLADGKRFGGEEIWKGVNNDEEFEEAEWSEGGGGEEV